MRVGRSSSINFQTLSILFFLSGVLGLSYEVVWFKQFSHVWGSSTLAMACVVVAFLSGLGLGARVFGQLAARAARPVLWYGVFEFGVGLLALVIPWETDLLWRFAVTYYADLRGSPIWYALVRCATTFLIIGPPCVLMGGTLPLLIRHLAPTRGTGDAAGWLYGINTLGAALGCYLMGFHVLPELGLFRSNIVSAALNLAIGFAVIIVTTRRVGIRDADPPVQDTPANIHDVDGPGRACPLPANSSEVESNRPVTLATIPASAAYSIALIFGFAALVLQTVWNRHLAVVLGSSTYAFSAMLVVILAGMGFGSLLYYSVLSKMAAHGSVAAWLLSGTVVSTVAGIWLLPFAAECVGLSIPLRASYLNNAIICLAACSIIELMPALLMGALFPCVIHLSAGRGRTGSELVGTVYAWNTVGSLIGGICCAVWIVPTWGTHIAATIALVGYLIVIALLMLVNQMTRKVIGALLAAGIAIGVFVYRVDDPRRTNMGMFISGYRRPVQENDDLLFFKEGLTSNVLVTAGKEGIALRVNGKTDGSSEGDMATQLGLAYLPRLLNPDARNVLVIGFGTGTTSGASLLFPETRVTCCELEPAIVKAGRHFEEVNHRPRQSRYFAMIYDDARAYVQGTSEKYDLIVSEPSNPWIAGVANLFTAEFYEVSKTRLASNGIFAQWIQTYEFAPDDYAMVVRTMREVFPHLGLIRISDGDTILLAANQRLEANPTLIENSQRVVDQSLEIQSDLNRYFGTTNVRSLLLTRMLLDEEALTAFIALDKTGRINRDSDLQLEFRAARHLFERKDTHINSSLLSTARPEWFTDQFTRLGCDANDLAAVHELAALFQKSNLPDTVRPLIGLGLSINPNAVELLADRLIIEDRLDSEVLDRLLQGPDPAASVQARRVGVAYWKYRRYADAANVFDRLCQRIPNSSEMWTSLGNSYAFLGRLSEAESAYSRAIQLDPTNEFSRREFDQFRKATGAATKANTVRDGER